MWEKGLVEWEEWKLVIQWKIVGQKFEKGCLSVVRGNRPFHFICRLDLQILFAVRLLAVGACASAW